jgi:hypothetical protein
MATGKRPLSVLNTSDNADTTLANIVTVIDSVRSELATLPGVGELLAGEAIDAGKAIYISGNTVYKASAAVNQPAIGVSISKAAAAGSKIRFVIGMGYTSALSGLTPNSSVYLGNAGGLVYAIPGAGMKQALGWAFSATELFVTIGQPF